MSENNGQAGSIQISLRAVLGPTSVQKQPRMRRKILPLQRVRSIERTFQELTEKLLLHFSPDLVLSVSSEILMEGENGCPAQRVGWRLHVLRSMRNVDQQDWKSLKRACRIALLELGENTSMEHIYSRIQHRGSHEFIGTGSPAAAIRQALATIGCQKLTSGPESSINEPTP